jgi:hypothetical protein
MKKLAIVLAVIIVALLAILIFYPAKGPTAPGNNPVIVNEPLVGALIGSPVTVQGTVTGGGWFFEASFPVKVLDSTGRVIGQSPAQAQPAEAWMSTGTVAFTALVTFTAPKTATGSIVLSKDNPSGLPANDQSFSIPVRFK